MSHDPRRRIPTALTLMIGLALGWMAASYRPTIARATGGDRYGEDSITTGAVSVMYNEGNKVQSTQEAVYYLDYRGGRLLATIPAYRQSLGAPQVIDEFAERDLITDFKIDIDKASTPHFQMTTGSLGVSGAGWSPLFVFETTSKQVAVYKVQTQSVGTKSRPKFELIELKSFAALPVPPRAN